MIVLDASALPALLSRAAGFQRVSASVDGAAISVVNLAEVLGRLARDGGPLIESMRRIAELDLDVVPLDGARCRRLGSGWRTAPGSS